VLGQALLLVWNPPLYAVYSGAVEKHIQYAESGNLAANYGAALDYLPSELLYFFIVIFVDPLSQ
jgi:hypothetical protein